MVEGATAALLAHYQTEARCGAGMGSWRARGVHLRISTGCACFHACAHVPCVGVSVCVCVCLLRACSVVASSTCRTFCLQRAAAAAFLVLQPSALSLDISLLRAFEPVLPLFNRVAAAGAAGATAQDAAGGSAADLWLVPSQGAYAKGLGSLSRDMAHLYM